MKFIKKLKALYKKGLVKIPDRLACLKAYPVFDRLLDVAVGKNWRVYSKKPFAGPEQVVRYIGRYTHRIALSNYRIISIDNQQVRFRYKDYKDNNTIKVMTLSADEFIRRFLLHILPEGFKKIRFFGFLSSYNKKKVLAEIRLCLAARGLDLDVIKPEEQQNILECPKCGEGVLIRLFEIEPIGSVSYANSS